MQSIETLAKKYLNDEVKNMNIAASFKTKISAAHISPKDAVADLLDKYFGERTVTAKDTITVIDFKQSIEKIKNFKELPKNVQDAIKSADHIESKGFQELLGYDKSNKIIWSAGGHWDGRENKPSEKFIVENFGGMACPTCKQTIQWSNNKTTASTGQYCHIYKASDNFYYMILDKHTYGSFDDERETNTFLEQHFANPGGYSIDHSGKQKPPSTVKTWYHNRWVDTKL